MIEMLFDMVIEKMNLLRRLRRRIHRRRPASQPMVPSLLRHTTMFNPHVCAMTFAELEEWEAENIRKSCGPRWLDRRRPPYWRGERTR